ncbi:MAG: septum formation initiator family protein [Prevotella sp.]|nr:septum formation initiator family protein [Prevotella sp.]
MKKIKTFFRRVYHIPALKYIVVAVLAVILVGFVDENSVMRHMQNKQYIGELEEEIDRYTRQACRDQEQIHMLDSDPKAIEKIARERYFMKTDDEDIFVLSDDMDHENPFQ